jgi:hypothetical protein
VEESGGPPAYVLGRIAEQAGQYRDRFRVPGAECIQPGEDGLPDFGIPVLQVLQERADILPDECLKAVMGRIAEAGRSPLRIGPDAVLGIEQGSGEGTDPLLGVGRFGGDVRDGRLADVGFGVLHGGVEDRVQGRGGGVDPGEDFNRLATYPRIRVRRGFQ